MNEDPGVSVMVAAIRHGVAGINGDCGGSMDCATCHVYLDEAQSKLVPPPTSHEIDLLSAVVAERRPTSRLSCQLRPFDRSDELIVHVPDAQ